MVGDNAQGNIALLVIMIFYAGNVNNMLHNIADSVNLKEVVNALHDASESFKTHTGINIAAFKASIVSVSVVFKLGENKVPEFGISVAVTAGAAIRRAAAVFFTAVKVDFRTRAAGACTVFPEVIFFSESYNPFGRNTDFFCPNVKSLVIILIDGDPELVHGHFHNLSAKLPCPRGCLMLEVIAEREVAEHFKICSVSCGNSDALNVRCADALLAGGHTPARRSELPSEVFFERRHACVDEEQTLVALRNKGEAVRSEVSLAFKE